MIKLISKDSPKTNLFEIRKNQIMDISFTFFFKQGYDATTMRQIAKACKLTPASLYNYFSSKNDILQVLCEREIGDEIGRLTPILNKLNYTRPTEVLKEEIKVYFNSYNDKQDWLMFVNRQMFLFPRKYRHMLLDRNIATVEGFKNILKKGIETGEFQPESQKIELIANQIIAFAQDWVLRRWYLRDHFKLEEYTEKCTEAILIQITGNTGNIIREP